MTTKNSRCVIVFSQDKDNNLTSSVTFEPGLKHLNFRDSASLPPCVRAGLRLSEVIKKLGPGLGLAALPEEVRPSGLVDALGRPL